MIIITRILEFSINHFDPYLGCSHFQPFFSANVLSGRKNFILVWPWSWRLMGPPTALYIFFGSWLHLISGGRFFFYSSSTPRTKGKIKSQKSHIENQFIEIIKKMTRFWRENTEKSECQRRAHSRWQYEFWNQNF